MNQNWSQGLGSCYLKLLSLLWRSEKRAPGSVWAGLDLWIGKSFFLTAMITVYRYSWIRVRHPVCLRYLFDVTFLHTHSPGMCVPLYLMCISCRPASVGEYCTVTVPSRLSVISGWADLPDGINTSPDREMGSENINYFLTLNTDLEQTAQQHWH